MAHRKEQIETLTAHSLMGLMAAEGMIPGAVSNTVKEPFVVRKSEAMTEFAHDMNTGGSFFDLMVENGQMQDLPKDEIRIDLTSWLNNIRIHRPSGLGGMSMAH